MREPLEGIVVQVGDDVLEARAKDLLPLPFRLLLRLARIVLRERHRQPANQRDQHAKFHEYGFQSGSSISVQADTGKTSSTNLVDISAACIDRQRAVLDAFAGPRPA